MAKIHGKFGQLQFGEGAVTPAAINGINSWTITFDGDAEEATDFNSNGIKEYLPGCVGFTGSCEGFFNNADSKHKGSVATPPSGYPSVIPQGIEGQAAFWADLTTKWEGRVIITSSEYNCSVSGNVGFKMAFQGTGPLVAVPST